MNKDLRIMKLKIKKGDTVKLMLGKDNGKQGKVVRIDSKTGKVLVEGVNTYKRHVRKFQDVEGGIIDLPKPVDGSNLMLVCPNCKKATRVGYKIKGNEKLRICKKCQKEVDHVKA